MTSCFSNLSFIAPTFSTTSRNSSHENPSIIIKFVIPKGIISSALSSSFSMKNEIINLKQASISINSVYCLIFFFVSNLLLNKAQISLFSSKVVWFVLKSIILITEVIYSSSEIDWLISGFSSFYFSLSLKITTIVWS